MRKVYLFLTLLVCTGILNAQCLSGTYLVGTGQVAPNYPTLTAAINAYNSSCLAGHVIFELQDLNYTTGTGETFPITINNNTDAGPIKTLTIKPKAGESPSITGSSISAVIVLNGADYVIIDGSEGDPTNSVCPPMMATRDLTITNTSASAGSAVIWLQTAGANGSTNNIVMNTNLFGNSNTTTLFGVGSGSSAITTSSFGTGNNNNSFINNFVIRTQWGIFSQGASAGNKNSGNIINQNEINATAPDNVRRAGILAGFENNITISGNKISEISSSLGSQDVFGISLGTTAILNTAYSGNEVTNATITNNYIGSVKQTGNHSASGIFVAPATSGTTLIANNMISGVGSNGTAGDFGSGIFIAGGAGSATNIYYNSISIIGTLTGANDVTAGIAIGGSNPVVDMKNNIVVVTASTGANENRAIALDYSTYTNLSSDNNDLFVSGINSGIGYTGGIGAGTNRITLANWQAATGKDASSKNIQPTFNSATDLHLTNPDAVNQANLESTGAVVSVINDIDCEARPVGTPDIGADQFSVGAVLPVSLLYFNGYKETNTNQLRWSTSMEANNSGFEVQRSLDGINYSVIGFVNSLAMGGNSIDQLDYQFTDNNPTGDRQWYRLRQVNNNGSQKFSSIVLIKGARPVTIAIAGLFPNPANETLNMSVDAPARQNLQWQIIDMTGRILMNRSATIETGTTIIPIDIRLLSGGQYLLKLVCASGCVNTVAKFVKE